MTETDAETLLAGHLLRSGGQVVRQVRLGLNTTDVVVTWNSGPRAESIEAIEVKLSDWRRGAHQAYLSGTYAHAASVALPKARLNAVDRAYLAQLGVGLIVFDAEGWSRALEPRLRFITHALAEAVESSLATKR